MTAPPPAARLPPLSPAPAHLLVKEVNWLGDLVMTLPALRAIRRAFPHARLAVLIRQELASFFDGLRWVDEVIGYRIRGGIGGVLDRRRLVRDLRARQFDAAIVLPRSFESALWVALARIPRRIGYVADQRGPLLTHRAVRDATVLARHQVHDYLHLLQATLGIAGDPAECSLDVDPRHRAAVEGWLAAHRRRRGPLIALAPAAAYGPAKEWPAARWAALVDRLAERHAAECVLVGAPGERAKCDEIAGAARHGALVAAGQTSVGQAVALLARCNGFAGNDSGSMHVAGALGIPTVGIFGSTNPQRTAPLGPRTRVLYERVACSPCLERTCRYGHYECLTRISVDAVEEALGALKAF